MKCPKDKGGSYKFVLDCLNLEEYTRKINILDCLNLEEYTRKINTTRFSTYIQDKFSTNHIYLKQCTL